MLQRGFEVEHVQMIQCNLPLNFDKFYICAARGDIHWTDAEAELQEQLQQLVVDLQPYV